MGRLSQLAEASMIDSYRGVVRPHHLDHMGHMNVQWYTAKFDEATWHLFAALGLTTAYFRQANRGMAALEQTTKYLAEAMAGDLLACRSEVLEVREKTIRFLHHLHNAESDGLIASSELVAAHIALERRKACPLPDAVKKECQRLIERRGGG